jgi:O-antigen ligase
MADVFQVTSTGQSPVIQYADELQFGERVVYWQTGWNIFNDHPVLGVGIGYSGYYFPKYLPDIGWELAESRALLYRSSGLLNIKNLWVRLLAETGIAGFSLFLTFLVITLVSCVQMTKKRTSLQKMLGFSGIFMLIAFVLEGFSVDSFALPYLWFTLGLVIAGWRWGDENQKDIDGSI